MSERIKRLEEVGIIDGFAATIDPVGLGLPVSAILRIRPMPGELHRVIEILRSLPEVVECDRVTGEDCLLARVHLPSIEDLEAVIDEIAPYAMTNTSIVQSRPVRRRLPPIPRRR